MRLLHLVHDLPPDSRGGTQEYVLALAHLQREAGHVPAVVAGAAAHAPGGATGFAEEDGIAVWRLRRDHETEALPSETGCPRLGAEIERIARAFGPDLVHLHHWHGLGRDLVQRLSAALPAPIVVTLHDLYSTCPRFFRMPDHRRLCALDVSLTDCAGCLAPDLGLAPEDGAGRAALAAGLDQRAAGYARELESAALVLTVSTAQRDLLSAVPRFPRLSALEVLPIGIADPPPARPAPPAAERLRVVSWAGFDPRKGLHDLVRAVAESPRRAALELHLFGRPGEPAYMAELRALAAAGGPQARVLFHGEYDDRERAAFGGRFDLAVFPYLAWETYALAVDEALFCGLPVVTSNLGAPPDRLGGRGATFPAGDARALGALLGELADDRARLARMRAAPHGALALRDHHEALLGRYQALLAGRRG